MASRRYRSFKFSYTNDLGNTAIKHQRLDPDLPSIPLLDAVEYNTASKLESQGNTLRYVEFLLNDNQKSLPLPYAPGELNNLKSTITQIAAIPGADSLRYNGESQLDNGYYYIGV